MIIENVDIYSLIPSQINEMIDKLKSALNLIKCRKSTISKIASFEKNKCECPYCTNNCIVKNGHTKTGIQTYKCKNCGKRFNDLTGTIFSRTRLTYEQIEIFIVFFNNKLSLRKTAAKMNVDKNTVHLLRLKVLDSLKMIRKNTELSGEVEADELYKSINLKGTKTENMPRASKPRQSKGTTIQGINNHKICILSALDENDHMFLEIVGNGVVTSNMVKNSLTPKMKKVTKLITDCKNSYKCEAKANKWNLKQVKSNGHVDDEGNNLANINSVHSGLTTFLSPFRGVSTKHLQGYLDWYIFYKYLQYSFDDNKQEQIILNKLIIEHTEITSNNMYDNQSGINFKEVYSDYN